MKFSCPEKECRHDGGEPYILSIPQEACIDVNNMATPFCPRCGNTLTLVDSGAEHFER